MTSPILKEATAEDVQKSGNPPIDNDVEVEVEVREMIGVIVLGVLFFIVLMTLLKTQKRERKLLEEMGDLRVKLQKAQGTEAKS